MTSGPTVGSTHRSPHGASVTAVVPAAGHASRFGGPKLVADVGGVPLIDRTLAALLDAGVDGVVVVTQAGASFDGATRLADPRVRTVVNREPDRGMFSSIQIGLAAADDADTLIVLPADMPFVEAATVTAVIARAREADTLVVPTYRGTRGHPIAFPRLLRDTLLRLDPTSTLKIGVAATSPVLLEVDDPGILRDVDVPSDLPR